MKLHFLNVCAFLLALGLLVGGCKKEPTCFDGEQNGQEQGVDCGGECDPCISCSNGIQDGGETGVDCGGDCPDACPTCTDGIQNGDEEGVDCGGSCPDVCAIVSNVEQFLTSDSDLPGNIIYDLELSGSTLWLATNNGAATFDGSAWTIYNTSNSGLPHNDVRDIHFDAGGSPWFATWGGGVARLNNSVWEVWNSSVSGVPSDLDLADKMASSLNWMVVTVPGNGFVIWDGSTWTQYSEFNSDLPSNSISGIASGSAGELYFSTLDAGLVKFDFPNFTTWNSTNSGLPNDVVHSVHFLRDERLAVGTQQGLVFKEGAAWTVFDTGNSDIRTNSAKVLWTDIDDRTWLVADGLSRFDGSEWVHFSDENSHPGLAFAQDVIINSSDRIWVGTLDRGLIAFDY